MNHLNSVVLEGVISSDPRLVTVSESGYKLVKFDVASHRRYKDKKGEMQDDVLFLPVLAWGELSERCLSSLAKGMQCRVLGRLRLAKWKNKEGSERRSIELVCDHVEFSRRKGTSSGVRKDEIVVFDQDPKDAERVEDAMRESLVVYDGLVNKFV